MAIQEARSQGVEGRWYGEISLDHDDELHYLLDIRQQNGNWEAYADMPYIHKFRLRADSFSFVDQQLYYIHNATGLSFTSRFDTLEQRLVGHVIDEGIQLPLTFHREPQTPRHQHVEQPIPYDSKEVFFYNKDNIRLAGTLTTPPGSGPFPAVVLVSGSGPQDRNEEILGHRPFLILADHLTRQGIAVLRYDDRGYGESEGDFRPATSLDYTHDALAAVEYLKGRSAIDNTKIGIAGHSEGGNIAPVAAVMDSTIAFVVLLAAPGLSNYESYLVSLALILKDYDGTYDRDYAAFAGVYQDMATISNKVILRDSLRAKFTRLANQMTEEELEAFGGLAAFVEGQVRYHTSDWYHYYLQFDVTPYLQQLKIPILALNGTKDESVEANANLGGIQRTLEVADHPQFEIVKLRNVNHFFQTSTSPTFASVYFNPITFAPEALNAISEWINEVME